jgi:hypothetical protein
MSLEQINSENRPLHLHHDQQGATRLLTESTRAVEGSFTYSPYGELTGYTGSKKRPRSGTAASTLAAQP